jgi:hypothetical protein
MRLPDTQPLVRELIRQFGLRLLPFENMPHAYFVEGTRIEYSRYVYAPPEDKLLKVYLRNRAGTDVVLF